ncbi:AAA family ATPase [Rhizobiaceae bacterium n13]|uniref:AAA family ATPase n=1 Tax=Ferirhizobium litorale TaxID=2927786 RepID=A0AAE3QEL3_9HYPH|nr:AAA family ATPase [Fererhizobium litorale]MDI7862759.1 AAA family ATPase [Fererhizobium litorale]MDI7924377.1 AAA family ATPase [Fererhizobium litorale]
MIVEDQSDVIAYLKDPATYGISDPVVVMETHISYIFLAGDRAYKMKRAVKLPYVDFSTPGLRLSACRKEVELNATTAPGLYLGVKRIVRGRDGTVRLDGEGMLLDAVVEMERFDQEQLFDRMALADGLTPALMTEVARMIVRFHRAAPTVGTEGGAANMAGVLEINEAGFATSRVFTDEETTAIGQQFRRKLSHLADRMDKRAEAGKIRRCHGDLHLRNICLLDGEPRLFDCIEFNDQIATVDTLYDLAFLLMDLWHRGFSQLANLVMNRYLDESDDEDGFVLLPYYMAVRAAVRAHVTATQVEEESPNAARLADEARSYFDLAQSLLRDEPPRLVAIGGLSGSGKTTVAEALATKLGPPPGARIVESDRIRKAMHGVAAETRLPAAAYRGEISERVYREMAWRASLILSEGGTVVADAVFDRSDHRDLIEKAAKDPHVPFCGIWLEADPAILWQRVDGRKDGPSDATVDILARQLDRKIGDVGWQKIDAALPPEEVVDAILHVLSTSPKG